MIGRGVSESGLVPAVCLGRRGERERRQERERETQTRSKKDERRN